MFGGSYDATTHFSGIPTVRSDVVAGYFVVPSSLIDRVLDEENVP